LNKKSSFTCSIGVQTENFLFDYQKRVSNFEAKLYSDDSFTNSVDEFKYFRGETNAQNTTANSNMRFSIPTQQIYNENNSNNSNTVNSDLSGNNVRYVIDANSIEQLANSNNKDFQSESTFKRKLNDIEEAIVLEQNTVQTSDLDIEAAEKYFSNSCSSETNMSPPPIVFLSKKKNNEMQIIDNNSECSSSPKKRRLLIGKNVEKLPELSVSTLERQLTSIINDASTLIQQDQEIERSGMQNQQLLFSFDIPTTNLSPTNNNYNMCQINTNSDSNSNIQNINDCSSLSSSPSSIIQVNTKLLDLSNQPKVTNSMKKKRIYNRITPTIRAMFENKTNNGQ